MQPVAYRFEGFELLVRSRRLVQLHGRQGAVTPRAFDLLLALVRVGKAGARVGRPSGARPCRADATGTEMLLNADASTRQRLAAILVADAAGYSRLMSDDEHSTMVALDAAREVFRAQIESSNGRVIDMAGDSVLAVFETATGAVNAALDVQQRLEALAAGVPAERRMRFRIGVHMGDVIEKSDGTVYGEGVNIAARLEGLALPGGVAVSDAIECAVRHRVAAVFEDLGKQQVKNIAEPVRAYRLLQASSDKAAAARAPRVAAQAVAYRFEGFELVPARRSLQRDGKEVAVTPRAFDLLVALVERAGELVSKNELLGLVWPKVIVEENNLQAQVSVLRKLLGPQAIATVPGRGYTFTLLRRGVQDLRADARRSGEASGGLRPGNLPAQLPPLYGRSDDVEALADLLQSHRVVSVVGPAGIGKTRIAQAVAHASRGSHADGAWLVELAPLADPLLLAPTVARVLGYAVAKDDAALPSLVEAMRDQRLLLVLDNCEHLPPAVAELATKILAGAPQVRLLVTSQEPLRIAEEHVDRLNPLAVPTAADATAALSFGAVELFVARAQAADPRFALRADNTADVVEICRRLDGIALALELAAARVPLLGVLGLRQRLDEQLRLLAGGMRSALPRHQTLRAALQWSHALLSPEERTVFERLGVFVGSFSMQAAQQLACDETIDAWAVLDHLAALVDKSLVLVEQGDVPRYRLLESSRAFALERLAAAGVMETLRRRHAQVMADTLLGDDPMEEPNARMRRIAPDLDNVRAAAAWAIGPGGDHEIAISLAGATDMLWDAQACNDEGGRLYAVIEPWVNESTPPRLAARYWFAVSNSRVLAGVEHQAEAGLRAAELYRTLGDRFWQFRALRGAAYNFSYLRDEAAARAALAEMLALLEPSWPAWCRTAIEHGLGFCEYFAAQRPEAARKHWDTAAELSRGAGGGGYFADHSEMMLVVSDNMLGDFESAARRAHGLLHGSGTAHGARSRAIILLFQGGALTALGRLEEAEAALRTAVPQFARAFGSAPFALAYAAHLLARQQRMKDAARLIGYIEGAQTAFLLPSGRRFCDAANAIVTAALDGEELDRLHAEGRRLTDAEALALPFPPRT